MRWLSPHRRLSGDAIPPLWDVCSTISNAGHLAPICQSRLPILPLAIAFRDSPPHGLSRRLNDNKPNAPAERRLKVPLFTFLAKIGPPALHFSCALHGNRTI